jgi:signal transduction histidine kinase
MATADPRDRRETLDQVAASVDRHRSDIARQVLRSLRRAGSRLARDPATRDQLRVQVMRVLDDTLALLRGGIHADRAQRADLASIELGRQRARHGIQPDESMRAESALFEAALLTVVRDLRHVPLPVDGLTRFCLALQRSLTWRAALVERSHLTHLLDQICHAHAQQRLRLSRELHDQVAQTTAVALHDLELYEVYRGADSDRAQARLSAAKVHLRETIDTVRALSNRLRRTDASEGLQPALVRYLSSAAPAVATSVTVTGADSSLPIALRDELFLVLREALSNALHHANARAVTVDVRIGADRVDATVTDDGRGFDAEGALAAPSGAGLPSMLERAYAAGGSVTIVSQARKGTTVRVAIPLPGRPV